MKRCLGLAGLVLLAGCNGWPFSRPYTPFGNAPADSLRGECERAAYDDPEVKDALARAAGRVNYSQEAAVQWVADARRQVVQRCMLQRGGPQQGGGVELPRR